MRRLLLFSFLLTGCAGKTIYMEKPTLYPLYKNTDAIRTIIKTITTTNQTALTEIETKLNEQDKYIVKSENAIEELALDNSKKQQQILNLTLNESKLTVRNTKLLVAIIITSILLLGSIALRFINIKLL